MSYLNLPRLTFAGQFQADPSTVNNTPTNFKNEGFDSANGLWNPNGTGNWRFIGCTVTSVTYKDGTGTVDPAKDPIIGMSLMDANTRVAGKIVDLDSQQQMVSMLWGLVVRIVADGVEVMNGDYEPAAFSNIWFRRSTDLSGSRGASAVYQSIIKNIKWDIENTNSRYLKELKETSPAQLSIQFNVDRYQNGDNASPQFTLGRIEGSIGPSNEAEPNHFVLGRQLFPQPNSNLNYAVAVIDEKLKKIVLDMGNSLQFGTGGKIVETRKLVLAINKGNTGIAEFVNIGEIDYADPEWYANSAGICTFDLSDENLKLVTEFPLVIVTIETNQKNIVVVPTKKNIVFNESVEYVCADQFVFRLNPGESCSVDFYATKFGKPIEGKSIVFKPDTQNIPRLQPDDGDPAPGTPDNILNFLPNSPVNTNAAGKAVIKITASDPGNPRDYIDGQIYGITYNLSDQDFDDCNPSNFISLLVFDSVAKATIENPTWANLQPIMQQYANLYPLMSKGIFNLADQKVVDNNAEILKFVFSKEKTDPDYMPATRDLSRDKQQMILNYLDGILGKSGEKEAITFKKI